MRALLPRLRGAARWLRRTHASLVRLACTATHAHTRARALRPPGAPLRREGRRAPS